MRVQITKAWRSTLSTPSSRQASAYNGTSSPEPKDDAARSPSVAASASLPPRRRRPRHSPRRAPRAASEPRASWSLPSGSSEALSFLPADVVPSAGLIRMGSFPPKMRAPAALPPVARPAPAGAAAATAGPISFAGAAVPLVHDRRAPAARCASASLGLAGMGCLA